MAKGQQRSNKETKKPKAQKGAAPASSSSSMTRGQSEPITPPKKKA